MDEINRIILELKQKNHQSFETFYHLTKNQVFYAIIPIIKDRNLTEDLMQETYMKFLENISNIKINANPVAYLSTIARNLALNTYNKRKKEIFSEDIIDNIQAEVIEQPSEDIFKLLDILDQDEKAVITLHVINDLKFREVASVMKKPLGTVLWIYQKGIKKMKERVGEII
ncbi:MAG: RNA polymerase sigma factor [Acholeplasmataceae bacterium]|nr:RNA polymerase sigma factor [Acholeplasmataceae bacterium]